MREVRAQSWKWRSSHDKGLPLGEAEAGTVVAIDSRPYAALVPEGYYVAPRGRGQPEGPVYVLQRSALRISMKISKEMLRKLRQGARGTSTRLLVIRMESTYILAALAPSWVRAGW